MNEMLSSAQTLLAKTARNMGLNQESIKKLLEPEKSHSFSVEIRMDDGSTRACPGFRVQHNNTLGPYKGGIRFHPNVNLEEVQSLATLMSVKCSVAGLDFGGAKGGVAVDPKDLSEAELEKLSRSYVRQIGPYIGWDKDVPAPDVNTNSKIIGWMVDEYIKIQKSKLKSQNFDEQTLNKWKATFTGKPLELGGSEGRDEATGRGGVIILKALLSKLNSKLETRNSKLSITIQGFGNVGYHFAKVAAEESFPVVSVSDSKGGVVARGEMEALDIPLVMDCKKEKGYVAGCYCVGGVCDLREGRQISNEELLELPADILVPAALENVINGQNMSKIKAKIIVEMANGPVSDEAYEYLTKNGVIIVPDILANAGGVIVSYFEWLQNIKNEKWSKDQVFQKLEEMLKKAFEKVWQLSESKKIPLKQAALEVALERITGKHN